MKNQKKYNREYWENFGHWENVECWRCVGVEGRWGDGGKLEIVPRRPGLFIIC